MPGGRYPLIGHGVETPPCLSVTGMIAAVAATRARPISGFGLPATMLGPTTVPNTTRQTDEDPHGQLVITRSVLVSDPPTVTMPGNDLGVCGGAASGRRRLVPQEPGF